VTTPSGFGYAAFADRVGTTFQLRVPDGEPAALVLTECADAGPGAFSLIFKAGPGAPAAQALYEISAPGFGAEAIFLVPVARRPDDAEYPLEYQAIFTSSPLPAPSA
jgi:hypothetical protein